MKAFGKLASAVLLLGVLSPSFAGAQKPAIPKSERECVARGGIWAALGLPNPGKAKTCELKATDSGNSCSDSTQCQGICVAPDGAKAGVAVNGSCSPYLSNFGNLVTVENGKAQTLNVE